MITIDDAIAWLTQAGESHLSDCSQDLLERMQQALAAYQLDQVSALTTSLKKTSKALYDELEEGEALLKGGRLLLQIGQIEEAGSWFRQAARILKNHPHQYAAALWVQGWALLHVPSNQGYAMSIWQKSIDIFDDLMRQSSTSNGLATWYKQQVDEMKISAAEVINNRCVVCDQLRQASNLAGAAPGGAPSSGAPSSGAPSGRAPQPGGGSNPPGSPPQPPTSPSPGGNPPPKTPTVGLSNPPYPQLGDLLSAPGLSCLDGATCGIPKPVLVQTFLIDGKPYRYAPIPPGKRIYWDASQIVLQVMDDSMQAAGLENGDWVLVHQYDKITGDKFYDVGKDGKIRGSQLTPAQAYDQMIAVVGMKCSSAAAKPKMAVFLRFEVENNILYLSTKKEVAADDERFEFDPKGDFRIFGRVEGVFKPA